MSKKVSKPTFTTVTSGTRTTSNTNLDLHSEPDQKARFIADLRKATRRLGDESGRVPRRTSE